ncbi:MAG: hypothetical protein NVS3B26_29070 [Mycobacteriales bacterium]
MPVAAFPVPVAAISPADDPVRPAAVRPGASTLVPVPPPGAADHVREPRVELTFRDGTTASVEGPQALALHAIARSLRGQVEVKG